MITVHADITGSTRLTAACIDNTDVMWALALWIYGRGSVCDSECVVLADLLKYKPEKD